MSEFLPDDVAFVHDTDILEQVCDPVSSSSTPLIDLHDDECDSDPWASALRRSQSVTDLHGLSESGFVRKRHKSESDSRFRNAKLKRSKSLPNCQDLVDKQIQNIPYTTNFDFWYENFWKTWSKNDTSKGSKSKKKRVKIVEEANQVIHIKEESEVKQKLAEMLGKDRREDTSTKLMSINYFSPFLT